MTIASEKHEAMAVHEFVDLFVIKKTKVAGGRNRAGVAGAISLLRPFFINNRFADYG
jgi:hypothetical protein